MDVALVYMVAGISSRFGGKIKQFAKVSSGGETLIERSLKQALPAGFTKIIFMVGNKTEKPFKEKFGNSFEGIPVYYAKQMYDEKTRDRPWGTTDAVCAAKDLIDCPFVLANGDDLYGKNSFRIIVDYLKEKNEMATIGFSLGSMLPDEGTVNRGVFKKDENDYLIEIKEVLGISKENMSERGLNKNSLCNPNLFGLKPEVIEYLKNILEKFKKEHKGDRKVECLLPIDLSDLISKRKIKIKVLETPDKWMGVTNPGDELIVQKELENQPTDL